MKRAFIRALWGTAAKDYDNEWVSPSGRRLKMDKDIDFIIKSPFTAPFITYVFGEENYNYLKSLNVENCVLLDKRPFLYDLQKEFWRQKLDILKYAMEVDGYEEIVYLDWDCLPLKAMDDKFWELLAKKREIQANLQIYMGKKCKWRGKFDIRKVSNGGFIYIRDKSIPQKLIESWQGMETSLKFWDEIAISKLIDELTNGWVGVDKYLEDFEPEVCNLKKKSVYPNKTLDNAYFVHYIQSNNNSASKNKLSEDQ